LISNIQGDTAKIVHGVFVAARALVPCVLFLDECDAFCPPREGNASGMGMGNLQGASGAALQALAVLLEEFDELDHLRGDAACAPLPHVCLLPALVLYSSACASCERMHLYHSCWTKNRLCDCRSTEGSFLNLTVTFKRFKRWNV
jgi:SpoVK/Ycf46/Vps4 family AAA+-type ATPase